MLANAYHLHLRPGDELIARAGGLHGFMGWTRPILTDSGGFQVFSLAGRRTITEDGVVFQSHLDGRRAVADARVRRGHSGAARVRRRDDLRRVSALAGDHDEAAAAMQRTLRWARRGRDRFQALSGGRSPDVPRPTPGQAQFGIVQGGTFKDLRDESVAGTVAVGFEAYAIGGLSVGEPPE